MRWQWDLEPRGLLKLLGPLIVRIGRRQEQAVWLGPQAFARGAFGICRPRDPGAALGRSFDLRCHPPMERRRVHRPRRVGARVDQVLVRVAAFADDVQVAVLAQVGELERQHPGLAALRVQDADEVPGQVDVPDAHQPKLVLTKSETAEQAERDLIAKRRLCPHEPVEHITRVRVTASATP